MSRTAISSNKNIIKSGEYIVDGLMLSNQKVSIEIEVNSTCYILLNNIKDILELNIDINKDKKDKRNLVITLTDQGRELKDRAVCVPFTLAEEPWLSVEEAKEYRRLLYKIIHEGKELKDEDCD